MYQDWLFKDCPGGWRLRYRRNGGGYEASRDGERWEKVPSVTEVTGRLNKNLQDWAVRQVVEYLQGELVPGLVLTEEEVNRLLDGASKAHRLAAQRAAGRGADLHAWAEAYLKGQRPPFPEEEPLRGMALALADWWDGNGGEALRSEEAVFHPEHRYAGRVDLVARLGGRVVVVDLKTSPRAYPEHPASASSPREGAPPSGASGGLRARAGRAFGPPPGAPLASPPRGRAPSPASPPGAGSGLPLWARGGASPPSGPGPTSPGERPARRGASPPAGLPQSGRPSWAPGRR